MIVGGGTRASRGSSIKLWQLPQLSSADWHWQLSRQLRHQAAGWSFLLAGQAICQSLGQPAQSSLSCRTAGNLIRPSRLFFCLIFLFQSLIYFSYSVDSNQTSGRYMIQRNRELWDTIDCRNGSRNQGLKQKNPWQPWHRVVLVHWPSSSRHTLLWLRLLWTAGVTKVFVPWHSDKECTTGPDISTVSTDVIFIKVLKPCLRLREGRKRRAQTARQDLSIA